MRPKLFKLLQNTVVDKFVVLVQFYPQFHVLFPLVLYMVNICMTMSIKQRKIKNKPRIKLNCHIFTPNVARKVRKGHFQDLVDKIGDSKVLLKLCETLDFSRGHLALTVVKNSVEWIMLPLVVPY